MLEKPKPENEIKDYFRGICKAVRYLHSVNILHQNIKPENILLNSDRKIKVSDYLMNKLFTEIEVPKE